MLVYLNIHNISVSETSETSFEELVVIQERQEAGSVPQLAAREDADRLAALDALAVRSGLSLAKQVLCLPYLILSS